MSIFLISINTQILARTAKINGLFDKFVQLTNYVFSERHINKYMIITNPDKIDSMKILISYESQGRRANLLHAHIAVVIRHHTWCNFRIPQLNEIYKRYLNRQVHIDIKGSTHIEQRLEEYLEKHGDITIDNDNSSNIQPALFICE
jgi:hypothetical protein